MANESTFLTDLADEIEQLRESIDELILRMQLIDSHNHKAKNAFRMAIESLSREYKIKSDWYTGLTKCSEGGADNGDL